ncbi:3-deoxy-D-manno-octulosonic acid transferase [beta proteobacterium MWH-UniP1]
MADHIIQDSETLIEKAARALYSIFGISLLPLLVAHLLWRGIKQPDYLQYWAERFFGMSVQRSPRGPQTSTAFPTNAGLSVMWIHAVSVGETRAAAPLIEQWLAKGDAHRVVLTHTTPTGRETGQNLFTRWLTMDTPRVVQRYLPYDLIWANAMFLAWAQPTLGVLMETELWPNLLAQARRRSIPVVLINARLSPRSAKRLQQFRWLSRPAIAHLTGIAAQTQADAQGFLAACSSAGLKNTAGVAPMVRMEVVGNMKFDIDVPQPMRDLGNQWRGMSGRRFIWLAASTRDDEETQIAQSWQKARGDGRLSAEHLLVVVPRHPQRFNRVVRLLESAGLTVQRRSSWNPHQACDVLVGDSLGEMFAYLQMSDLVFMGGSLPALGGQNPVEACAVGRPVFFGPNMFNFHQIARALRACGAGKEVRSTDEWIDQGCQLLNDAAAYAAARQAAQDFAQAHRGATLRTAKFLETILQAGR